MTSLFGGRLVCVPLVDREVGAAGRRPPRARDYFVRGMVGVAFACRPPFDREIEKTGVFVSCDVINWSKLVVQFPP